MLKDQDGQAGFVEVLMGHAEEPYLRKWHSRVNSFIIIPKTDSSRLEVAYGDGHPTTVIDRIQGALGDPGERDDMELVRSETKVVYAGKGYVGNRAEVKRQGIRDGIHEKASRGHPLTKKALAQNSR